MTVETGSLFNEIPEVLGQELFTQLAQGSAFRLERIVSRGHTSPESGWYDQEEDEWVVVLQGEAKIYFYDQQVEHLIAGSYINIPARTRHRVGWTSPDTETVWLAVHYKA